MYSLHDMEVTGLSLTEVLACEIESQIGEHSTLMLTGIIDSEELLYGISDCQDIEVALHKEEGKEILFSGIVTGIQISESGQMKTVQIEGKSRSWLMDRTKRSRSFQNGRESLLELILEILQDYEGSGIVYAADNIEIGNLIVQYEETDWAFLQRVLSLVGLSLTPDSRQEGVKLYAGIPALLETVFSYDVLEMDKDMENYYRLKANGREVYTADFTQYWTASEQILGILQTTIVQGQLLTAYVCRYSFEGQELTGIYGMQSARGLTAQAAYPMHLIGVALTGKVVNVSGTKIQAALEIDGKHKQRAVHWFPYSTLSASSDGSGWYCMPEIGDDVRIYFPSKREAEAVALSAVSSYSAPQDGGQDRMQDPNSRYLRTKYGQELALNTNYVRLSCGKEASDITIQTDGKVIIQAKTLVSAYAQNALSIYAQETLTIHALNLFAMQSTQGSGIAACDGEVILAGTEVKLD